VRPPAKLEPWLTRDGLKIWVQDADSAATYRQRLVVWLTAQHHHAPDIASDLQLSTRTVRRLIARYNTAGPDEFEPQGWGGRRWGYLSPAQERRLLRSFERQAGQGRLLTREHMRSEVEATVGHPVSLTYLGELLRRGHWRKLTPRPLHKDADPEAIEAFKKNSRPCSDGLKALRPRAST
jgi:transposase